MLKRVSAFLFSLLAILTLASCTVEDGSSSQSASEPSASKSSQEEPTPAPTSEPTPAPTPAPTPTPEPTPTREPTPTPEPELTEEEYKAQCVEGYDYKTLARDPATYVGTYAKFRGEVVQVMEGSGITVLRVNVTQNGYGYWEDTIYVNYIPDEGDLRILEDDIVTIYGEMMELKTYETVMGSSVTIPQVYAKYIELE